MLLLHTMNTKSKHFPGDENNKMSWKLYFYFSLAFYIYPHTLWIPHVHSVFNSTINAIAPYQPRKKARIEKTITNIALCCHRWHPNWITFDFFLLVVVSEETMGKYLISSRNCMFVCTIAAGLCATSWYSFLINVFYEMRLLDVRHSHIYTHIVIKRIRFFRFIVFARRLCGWLHVSRKFILNEIQLIYLLLWFSTCVACMSRVAKMQLIYLLFFLVQTLCYLSMPVCLFLVRFIPLRTCVYLSQPDDVQLKSITRTKQPNVNQILCN